MIFPLLQKPDQECIAGDLDTWNGAKSEWLIDFTNDRILSHNSTCSGIQNRAAFDIRIGIARGDTSTANATCFCARCEDNYALNDEYRCTKV